MFYVMFQWKKRNKLNKIIYPAFILPIRSTDAR